MGEWSGVPLRAYPDAALALAPGMQAPRDTVFCDAFWQAQLARFESQVVKPQLARLTELDNRIKLARANAPANHDN